MPSRQTYAGGVLDNVYVNGTMGNDSYDGSSPVPLSATVGPKKTIQAGIDAASTDSWVRVAEGVYRENIQITDMSLYLDGASARTTIIDGGANDPVILVGAPGEYVDIQGFTIRNGSHDIGGGILCMFSDLWVMDCNIVDNTAEWGGGILSIDSLIEIYGCCIANNSAVNGGGGVANFDGIMYMAASTVSGNSLGLAGVGGAGIYNDDSWGGLGMAVGEATIAFNSAPGAASRGGGFANEGYAESYFYGTIVANNTAGYPGTNNAYIGPDAVSYSLWFNIDSENTCGFTELTDQVNTDPLLGPLMNNGGWTDTHAITDYSPAFEKADVVSFEGIDQRWVPRPQGAFCDVGAYELIMEKTAVVNAVNNGGKLKITSSAGGIMDLASSSGCEGSGVVSGVVFPYGFLSFRIVGLTLGEAVQVTLEFPGPVPAGHRYMQCDGHGNWTDITAIVGHNNGDNIITLNLVDGGMGDIDHIANGRIVDPAGPGIIVAQRKGGSGSATHVQQPVDLPQLKVRGASLSSSSVKPGTAVTVTASVANTGTASGNMLVKLYVNGQEEDSRGIVVAGGSSALVAFTVARNWPGVYSVYVGEANAGSLTVGNPVGDGIILLTSSLMLIVAFAIGAVHLYQRRSSL
ncbi:MAG: hypothetical protein JW901_04435 [Dehalococcoidia bacterium]|nr:hypothetical protein [Dehalococcoidia bacterium]